MLFFYNVILYLLTPFLVIGLFVRSFRQANYRRRIPERFGLLPTAVGSGYIWLHSVSMGETLAAAPLVRALQARYPKQRLLITTMTPTGSEQVRRSFGSTVDHVYAPYDLPGCVHRFLERTKPSIAIIMETELWPNTLKQCHKTATPTVLINARLSASSAKGYARVSSITRNMMQQLDAVAVQSEADGERFVQLGLAPNKLTVTGSIKFDYAIDPQARQQLAQIHAQIHAPAHGSADDVRPADLFVWIAASTHQGEDEIMLDAQNALLRAGLNTLLILVPRHPERFDDVYRLCQQSGLTVARRSADTQLPQGTQVLLGDTMGELATLFGACKLAFIGGSLIERGGHNPIEPAAWGVPVLAGPHMFNFLDIGRQLKTGGGMMTVHNANDIAAHVQASINDPIKYDAAGASNRTVVATNRGAVARQLAVISTLADAVFTDRSVKNVTID
ncbi:MAG: lipid IV(A) 3-deoxy-D-manno-octulosonic acid transferase [Pseudomonadales bacterium]